MCHSVRRCNPYLEHKQLHLYIITITNHILRCKLKKSTHSMFFAVSSTNLVILSQCQVCLFYHNYA